MKTSIKTYLSYLNSLQFINEKAPFKCLEIEEGFKMYSTKAGIRGIFCPGQKKLGAVNPDGRVGL